MTTTSGNPSGATSWINGFDPREGERRDEAVRRLGGVFESITAEPDKQIDGWKEAWKKEITPWDRGRPNPALVDTLDDNPGLKSSSGSSVAPRKKKALVPGCGRGVDVILLASHGFDAYGLDTTEQAIESARALNEKEGEGPVYPIKASSGERGKVTFLVDNFFENEFVSKTHDKDEKPGFDIIYDYTFLCALPPALRPKWAQRMSELLAPDGKLICLEFPLQKPPVTGGPPHGLSAELYQQILKRPGEEVKYDADGYAIFDKASADAENALVCIERQKPRRTFAGSGDQVVEFLSIWEHKRG